MGCFTRDALRACEGNRIHDEASGTRRNLDTRLRRTVQEEPCVARHAQLRCLRAPWTQCSLATRALARVLDCICCRRHRHRVDRHVALPARASRALEAQLGGARRQIHTRSVPRVAASESARPRFD